MAIVSWYTLQQKAIKPKIYNKDTNQNTRVNGGAFIEEAIWSHCHERWDHNTNNSKNNKIWETMFAKSIFEGMIGRYKQNSKLLLDWSFEICKMPACNQLV